MADTDVMDAIVLHESLANPQALSILRPIGPLPDLVMAMQEYGKAKEALLAPSDYMVQNGKKFIVRSGWTKLQTAFGVSTEVRDGYPKMRYDDHDNIVYAECKVRAIAPNGRFAEGWGACSIKESRFAKANAAVLSKAEHDIPATAETRARNRACATLFGHGEVSAEELEAIEIHESAQAQYVRPATNDQRKAINDLRAQLKAKPAQFPPDLTFEQASDKIRELKQKVRDLQTKQAGSLLTPEQTKRTQNASRIRDEIIAELRAKGIPAPTFEDMSEAEAETLLTSLKKPGDINAEKTRMVDLIRNDAGAIGATTGETPGAIINGLMVDLKYTDTEFTELPLPKLQSIYSKLSEMHEEIIALEDADLGNTVPYDEEY